MRILPMDISGTAIQQPAQTDIGNSAHQTTVPGNRAKNVMNGTLKCNVQLSTRTRALARGTHRVSSATAFSAFFRLFVGRNPSNTNLCIGRPELTSAGTKAVGPGRHSTWRFSLWHACTNAKPTERNRGMAIIWSWWVWQGHHVVLVRVGLSLHSPACHALPQHTPCVSHTQGNQMARGKG